MNQPVIKARYIPFDSPRPDAPSPGRIGALSATLALNLGALIVLTLPLAPPAPPMPLVRPPMELINVLPDLPPPPPPPVTQPARRDAPSPAPSVAPAPQSPPLPASTSKPDEAVLAPLQPALLPSGPTPQVATEDAGAGAVGAQAARLEYVHAPPPRYPREALRAGLEGTVWLLVLVDSTGQPIEVSIDQGSGHRVLDEAARHQVLEQWRFQPAMRDGRAVPAWGRLPIAFTL